MDSHPTHADALFSITRSMWDMVTPDLRGVAYTLTEREVTVRFLYADAPAEWILEMVSVAETECMADFWPTLNVAYLAEHLPPDQPRRVREREGERWVYLRHEELPA